MICRTLVAGNDRISVEFDAYIYTSDHLTCSVKQ